METRTKTAKGEGNSTMNTRQAFGDTGSGQSVRGFRGCVGRVATLGAVVCLISGAAGPALAAPEGGRAGACTRTANAALTGCEHDVQDTFWVTKGNCYNLADAAASAACSKEARAARDAGEEECNVQFEARKEICVSLGEAPYDPKIDPAKFVDPAAIGKTVSPNPYFPLVRGRSWSYKGSTELVTTTVTDATRQILGVTCATVRDTGRDLEGQVTEDTKDWYAQDIYGNVWYFGEISQKFEGGELISIDGSWQAGVEGGKPGIIMKLAPKIGEVYRQEFALGNAEDMAQVLSLTESATVPATACSGNCLLTKEFQPFDPDAIENKYYASGVGFILEVNPATGERLELTEVKY